MYEPFVFSCFGRLVPQVLHTSGRTFTLLIEMLMDPERVDDLLLDFDESALTRRAGTKL